MLDLGPLPPCATSKEASKARVTEQPLINQEKLCQLQAVIFGKTRRGAASDELLKVGVIAAYQAGQGAEAFASLDRQLLKSFPDLIGLPNHQICFAPVFQVSDLKREKSAVFCTESRSFAWFTRAWKADVLPFSAWLFLSVSLDCLPMSQSERGFQSFGTISDKQLYASIHLYDEAIDTTSCHLHI